MKKKRKRPAPNFVARLPAETRAQLEALSAVLGRGMVAAACYAVDRACVEAMIFLPAGCPRPAVRPRAVKDRPRGR
jgi:hypothetical protein